MRSMLASLARRRALGRRPKAPPPSSPYVPEDDYLSDPYYASVVAFRGAQGYGANATGGRGNGTAGDTTLYFVDNLNDSGTGSLRAALEATGKRVIVPRVAGYVQTTSRIELTSTDQQNYTFLGQLAPGGGLGVRPASTPSDYPLLRLRWGNGIIRYLKLRHGAGGTSADCIDMWGNTTSGLRDLILDHISAAYASDEVMAVWGNGQRITIQNSLLTYPLESAGHPESDHDNAFLAGPQSARYISLLYTMLSQGSWRYPYFKGGPNNQMVGNVIYNSQWDGMFYIDTDATGNAADCVTVDILRNTYLTGPRTETAYKPIRVRNNYSSDYSLRGQLYLEGNQFRGGVVDEADVDEQWDWVATVGVNSGPLSSWRASSNLGTPEVLARTRAEAYTYVLASAGSSLSRDSLDTQAVNELVANSGPSSNPATVSSYPTIASGTYPTAADGVISDAWRTANGETRNWYELDSGGSGRMIVENYADDVADGIWVEP